ncbi:UNVERIFIED_CONTAM: hypothetical protein GTU68_000001 [Idotea baltica]|nr:hypothetical protein [Idotea baltica]
MNILIYVICLLLCLLIWRLCNVLSRIKNNEVTIIKGKSIRTLIFLGSGGHTGEMLKVVQEFDLQKYSPRFYVVALTDTMSSKKVLSFEDSTQNNNFCINFIPRSREVGQSWVSSFFSTLHSLIKSVSLVFKTKPDLILCNGPGSCVPVCIASFVFKVLGLANARMIFIESICRIKSLSLSGKILYYICDDIFVQWEHLCRMYPRAKYLGRVV